MASYLSQFGAVVEALRVQGSNSYSWRGSNYKVLPANISAILDEQDHRACLLSAIEVRLYSDFYCVGGVRADSQSVLAVSSQGATLQFVRALSDVNHGVDHYDPGWCILSASGNSLTIVKDSLRLIADVGDCQSDGPIVEGATVSLRTSKECFGMTPGFYLVVGSRAGAVKGSANTLVRLYWNVTPGGAIKLVDQLTQLLNHREIAFRLKVLRDPTAYQRCDAAVLYLSKEAALCIWDEVSQTYESVSQCIKNYIPAMTKQLAPGLGLAEDPGSSTSFGLHRCGLIGEGLVRAAQEKIRARSGRLKFISNRFAEEGVDVARPYLNRGSEDDYPTIKRHPKSRRNQGSSPESGDC
jgi:class II lanthipeptide synthase